MNARKKARRILLASVVLVTSLFELPFLQRDAHAIIGMPLTPMSYAGVARRTTRRAVYMGAAASPYYW
jgi:hypothetical protein